MAEEHVSWVFRQFMDRNVEGNESRAEPWRHCRRPSTQPDGHPGSTLWGNKSIQSLSSHLLFSKTAFIKHLAAIKIHHTVTSPRARASLPAFPRNPQENKIPLFLFVLENCMPAELGRSQNSDQSISLLKPSCALSLHIG